MILKIGQLTRRGGWRRLATYLGLSPLLTEGTEQKLLTEDGRELLADGIMIERERY